MTKLDRGTLGTDAYGAVRAMLLDPHRFQPGEKLSVEDLARALGVSRSPVWTAVARLEAEGLLEVSPRRGVFLVGYNPGRLRALFELREPLEGMAARLAATRWAAADLHGLDEALACGEGCLRGKDPDGFRAAALLFHEGVLRAARSPELERRLEATYARAAAMCRGRPDGGMEALRRNQDDHAVLLAALRAGEAGRAEDLARAHVRTLAEAALAGAG